MGLPREKRPSRAGRRTCKLCRARPALAALCGGGWSANRSLSCALLRPTILRRGDSFIGTSVDGANLLDIELRKQPFVAPFGIAIVHDRFRIVRRDIIQHWFAPAE